jgi:uncharacterized protein (TIGR03435 family)
MPDVTDMELVREYCARQSEPAFETLVHRHVNLVYSTALRQVGNPAQAEEITQAVFVILARKAARLRADAVLAAWLHETARHVAASFLRGEIRRRRREQEAYMQSTLQHSSDESVWEQLAPLLDEAIGRLRTADRNVVALRYFQNKSAHEIAAALNIGEEAAKKRLSRAVEKLRLDFYKRGINVSTAVLSGTVLAHSVQAAPAALAKSVTGVALAKGATASTSTLTLIKGALKIMAWTKAKTAIVVGAGLLLTAGTTTVVVEKAISPAVDETLWEVTGENLRKAPPVLIIRPTRFSDNVMVVGESGSQVISTQNRPVMNRTIAHNLDVAGLIQFAYACYSRPKLVLPAGVPTNDFDLMLTLRSHQLEMLQKAIQRQFGLTAHREIRETEALRLQVKDPGLLALHASKPGSKMSFKNGTNFQSYSDFPIDWEAEDLSGIFFKPVVLESGLSGDYDLTYRWENLDDRRQAVSKELAQAGLELVPTNLPIEMLVVEKTK